MQPGYACVQILGANMDWRAARFDWNRARAFLVTAEEGSFSAAARALQTTQPTVGRQVAALEEALGVALLERIGNRMELTEAGASLIGHARAMGEAAIGLSLAATGQADAPEGKVVVTASELISAYLLPPVVAELRRAHPGITLEVVASNALQDLRRREADIAVRNAAPTDPELFARKVGEQGALMYAAPSYIEKLGHPRSVEDLANAEFFGFADLELMIHWLRNLGLPVSERNFPVVMASHLVQWEHCKAGLGICFVMTEVGDAEPAVRRVLPEGPSLPVPIWLTSHRELRTSRRIRVVFDLLAEVLGHGSPDRVRPS